jgi:hypothetical protein
MRVWLYQSNQSRTSSLSLTNRLKVSAMQPFYLRRCEQRLDAHVVPAITFAAHRWLDVTCAVPLAYPRAHPCLSQRGQVLQLPHVHERSLLHRSGCAGRLWKCLRSSRGVSPRAPRSVSISTLPQLESNRAMRCIPEVPPCT